LPLLDR